MINTHGYLLLCRFGCGASRPAAYGYGRSDTFTRKSTYSQYTYGPACLKHMISLLTLGAGSATMDAVHRSTQSHTPPRLVRRRLLWGARQAPPAAARPRRKNDAVGRWTCCALLHICVQSKRNPSTALQADTKSTKATVRNTHGDAQQKHSQSFEQRASSNITLSASRTYGTKQRTGLDDNNTPLTHTEAGATNRHGLRIYARS